MHFVILPCRTPRKSRKVIGLISRFEQFTSSISTIYRYIQKIERDEMEKYGLKGAFAQYLMVMSRFPDGITAAQLCEICDKDKAAVSRIVAELEAKRLAVREGANYRALIRLTGAGRDAARFVQARAHIAVTLAGRGITDEERRVYCAALDQIATNLQTISKEGIPEQ